MQRIRYQLLKLNQTAHAAAELSVMLTNAACTSLKSDAVRKPAQNVVARSSNSSTAIGPSLFTRDTQSSDR